MFPNNETAKNYGCARTKTSSIINEYSSGCQKTLISVIKKIPFCISTDGNNDTDVKIYPIIISFFYHNPDNLKDDDDILIGHGTSIAVKSLSCTQKDQFYDHVKKFYTKACDYAFHKFPFNDEMLKHANVCNLELISSASFVDVKYFIDKFPIFFILCRLQHRWCPGWILQFAVIQIARSYLEWKENWYSVVFSAENQKYSMWMPFLQDNWNNVVYFICSTQQCWMWKTIQPDKKIKLISEDHSQMKA